MIILTTFLLATLLLVLSTRLSWSPAVSDNWLNGLFSLQLLGILGWQLAHIHNEEYNVDESTWIANALAVSQSQNFFSTLLTHTTARPVTVSPLLILPHLGIPLDFYSVKAVGLCCILLTLLLTYLSVRNLTNARFALLALFPITVFYLTVNFDDFLAYNSELVCNVLVMAGVWLFSLVVGKRERPWQLCLVGLSLGLIPFAKFQAIPGALIIVGFCLYEWIRQRRLAPALAFVFWGIMPILAAISYCLFTGQITVLIRNYFLYYVHYSSQYSTRPFLERFSPRNILYYYRKQHTFAAYWFGLLGLIGTRLWLSRRFRFRYSSPMLLVVLLWIVSIYETIQAGTNYEHYLSLVLLPHLLLAAVLIYPIIKEQQRLPVQLLYGYLTVALLIAFFSRTQPFDRGYKPPLSYDSQVVALIRQECRPLDQIVIWGWADRYYALSGIAPATRYANSVFQIKPNPQQAYYLDQYAQDINQNKPVLFIDAVAPHQFIYDDPHRYSHEQFSIINRIVKTDYQLIGEYQGLRVYKRKNKAGSIAAK